MLYTITDSYITITYVPFIVIDKMHCCIMEYSYADNYMDSDFIVLVVEDCSSIFNVHTFVACQL